MTRKQIIRAAAHQFAERPYHDVGLDDILAEAELTKGAMYFHFRSKHALALAVIQRQVATGRAVVQELVGRNLSGLETLIDVGYLMAVEDLTRDAARATLHLLAVVGRTDGLQSGLLTEVVEDFRAVAERAIAEGDLIAEHDPEDVVRTLLSLYLGLRQTDDLADPEVFLGRFERVWAVVLPGIVPADRIDYFRQFVRRRTALAVRTAAARAAAPESDGRAD